MVIPSTNYNSLVGSFEVLMSDLLLFVFLSTCTMLTFVPRLSTIRGGKPGILSHVSDVGVDVRVDTTQFSTLPPSLSGPGLVTKTGQRTVPLLTMTHFF